MFCGKCGTQLSDTDKFCPRCGEKVAPVSENNEPATRSNEHVSRIPEPSQVVHTENKSENNKGIIIFDYKITPMHLGALVVCICAAYYIAAVILPSLNQYLWGIVSYSICGLIIGAVVFAVLYFLKESPSSPISKWGVYGVYALFIVFTCITPTSSPESSSSSGGISSIFSIFKTKEQRIQEVRDLLEKAETVEDFEEVWDAYKSLTTEEKLELGVAKFNMDYMTQAGDKLKAEGCAILDMKGIFDEIDENMGLY